MKFEYVKNFKGKNSVKKQLIKEIKKEAHFTDEISELAVENYLEILIDGTDYDTDNHVFCLKRMFTNEIIKTLLY